jgi:protoporphyrinogen oxidase
MLAFTSLGSRLSTLDQVKHIGIVGGGIAGLTTAYRLATAGRRVTLWEREPHLGGLAAGFPVAGTHLEHFYHHLFQSDRDIVALAEELGLGDRLVWLPSNVGYFADGKIWPLNGALDLLRLGFLPLHDRLRLGLVTAYLQRVKDWKRFERVTAHDWLRRALGDRAYERTFGSQLKAKFGRYHDQVAMVWFWNKVYLRTTSRRSPLDQEKLGYFLGGFNVVIEGLVAAARAAGADLRPGSAPKELLPQPDGSWLVTFESGEEPMPCDAVVATVPSAIFARLVPALPEEYRRRIQDLTYEAAIVAILQLSEGLSDIYWLNIADPDVTFTAVIEHTNFVGPEHYDGKRFVYLGKYLEPDHPYFTLPDDQLLDAFVPDLRKINPAFEPSWIQQSWVFRARAAQPIVTLNYGAKLPDHRSPLPNLYLANMTQIYPEDRGTNYSVRLGNRIAGLVDGDLRAGRPWSDH